MHTDAKYQQEKQTEAVMMKLQHSGCPLLKLHSTSEFLPQCSQQVLSWCRYLSKQQQGILQRVYMKDLPLTPSDTTAKG